MDDDGWRIATSDIGLVVFNRLLKVHRVLTAFDSLTDPEESPHCDAHTCYYGYHMIYINIYTCFIQIDYEQSTIGLDLMDLIVLWLKSHT